VELTEKEKSIAKNMAWLVGRCLSYIDVTVESSPMPGDKYPKKEVLKKLFEERIYDARNAMFPLTESEIHDNMDSIFNDLFGDLTSLSTAAIGDKTQRNEFLGLISQRMGDTKSKLKEEIYGLLDV